jgi:hypothetical protein
MIWLAQPLAWWSTRHGSRLQAASRRAALPLAGAVVQRRRGTGQEIRR